MAEKEIPSLFVDLVRGVCGGCLFALPLIFTMEMWWLGYDIPTWQVVGCVVAGMAVLYGLNALSGYRESHGFVADLGDAVVSLAIGVVVSAVMLVTLGEIDDTTSALVALRQTILLALPVSFGVAVSRSQLAIEEDDDESESPGLPHRLGVSVAGGLVLGMSAAPTEEISMIASRVAWPHLLAMAAIAIAMAWAALFLAEFPRRGIDGLHAPWGEAFLVYAVGLGLSAIMLAGLGFLHGEGSPAHLLAAVITLAVPTTVGAAAGRLIL